MPWSQLNSGLLLQKLKWTWFFKGKLNLQEFADGILLHKKLKKLKDCYKLEIVQWEKSEQHCYITKHKKVHNSFTSKIQIHSFNNINSC